MIKIYVDNIHPMNIKYKINTKQPRAFAKFSINNGQWKKSWIQNWIISDLAGTEGKLKNLKCMAVSVDKK